MQTIVALSIMVDCPQIVNQRAQRWQTVVAMGWCQKSRQLCTIWLPRRDAYLLGGSSGQRASNDTTMQ